jgi:hypothetical protein
MNCARCGSNNKDDAAFCGKCGQAIKAEPQTLLAAPKLQAVAEEIPATLEIPVTPAKSKKKHLLIVVVLLVVLGAGAGFGGPAASSLLMERKGNDTVVSCVAEDSLGGEARDVLLNLSLGEFVFPLTFSYITPIFLESTVALAFTDFGVYPVVDAYFRVEDASTRQFVENIGATAFTINERLASVSVCQEGKWNVRRKFINAS